MQKQQNGPNFTHFSSLPFIRQTHREAIQKVQLLVGSGLGKIVGETKLRTASHLRMHLTLGMLSLASPGNREGAFEIYQQMRGELQAELRQTALTFTKIGYFTQFSHRLQQQQVSVIYLQPENDNQLDKVRKMTDRILRKMVEAHIVKPEDFEHMFIKLNQHTQRIQNELHLTLFRLEEGVPCDALFQQSIASIQKSMNPLTLQCDCIDISTRASYDQTQFYSPLARVKLESKG